MGFSPAAILATIYDGSVDRLGDQMSEIWLQIDALASAVGRSIAGDWSSLDGYLPGGSHAAGATVHGYALVFHIEVLTFGLDAFPNA